MKIKLEYDKQGRARLIEFEGTEKQFKDFENKHFLYKIKE